jgi:tetratricopeptide (TPR) repeat protein
MATITDVEMLNHAMQVEQGGDLEQASTLYLSVLHLAQGVAAMRDAAQALRRLNAVAVIAGDPNAHQIERLMGLYRRAMFQEVASDATLLSERYPQSYVLSSLLGAAHKMLRQLDRAEVHFRRACSLRPTAPDAHVNLGMALQEQGRWGCALDAYRTAVRLLPQLTEAHTNIGVILRGQGDRELALEAFRAAAATRPMDPTVLNNLGVALHEVRRLDEAAAMFLEALSQCPGYSDARLNLGNVLREQGHLAAAVEAYQEAVSNNSHSVKALNSLGVALLECKRISEADGALRKALSIVPDYAEARNNLGNVLVAQRRYGDAVEEYRKAIAIRAGYTEAYVNWAVALQELGRFSEAAAACAEALQADPGCADAHQQLGNALRAQGRLDDAIVSYSSALELRPGFAAAHNNMGVALRELGRHSEALEAYERALSNQSDFALAYSNVGVLLQEMGRLEAAEDAYSQAFSADPDCADAHWNYSLLQLLRGNFEQGWREYEWRWRRTGAPTVRRSGKPLWVGQESPKDRSILLWGEQGLGDQIQFARYAPVVADLGARVILEVDDALVRLFEGSIGVDTVVSRSRPASDEVFDFHCPLMSLPLALASHSPRIPPPLPLNPALRSAVAPSVRSLRGRRRIGVAWSGSPNPPRRSIPLAHFATLCGPDVDWVVLQKEIRASDLAALEGMPSLRRLGERTADFRETAELCLQCDLVISVDTSIAHLAGTLGRPAWVLLSHSADWRWLVGRDDSPWYPTVRLYRQDCAGDWGGVLSRVKGDLQTWLAAPSPFTHC